MNRLLLAVAPLLILTPALAQAPQGSMPPSQTREEAAQRAQMVFEQLDTDHDGAITQDEVAAFTRMMGDNPRIAARVTRMFTEADANHDGKLTAAEAKGRADGAFDAADADHDGVLSPEERQAARAKSATQAQQ